MVDTDFLKNQEVVEFIKENACADVNQLILNPPLPWQEKIGYIADQIISRKKAKGKLSDWVDNYHLIFPPPISIEQASSSFTSEYKKSLIKGAALIDLTGGTGIDCLSLSENFENTTYVEQNADLCQLFKHNSGILQKKISTINSDANSFLSSFNGSATFFIDPARRNAFKKKVFKLEDCAPNILKLIPELRKKANNLLIKLSPFIDLKDAVKKIAHVKEAHILSIKNDCKELLLLVDFTYSESLKIHAVNLLTDQPTFVFDPEKEKKSETGFGQVSTYLYEPNASILKAGAFKSIGKAYGINKIARNTHLYTSDDAVENFPGRIFKVLNRDGKRDLDKYASRKKINVTTRNYTTDASSLKKKFNLQDGGENFLIGFKDQNNKPVLVIAKRLFRFNEVY